MGIAASKIEFEHKFPKIEVIRNQFKIQTGLDILKELICLLMIT